jgi:hypothetical protein
MGIGRGDEATPKPLSGTQKRRGAEAAAPLCEPDSVLGSYGTVIVIDVAGAHPGFAATVA